MSVLHNKSQKQSFGEQQNSPDRQQILKIASFQISPSKLEMWLWFVMLGNRVWYLSDQPEEKKALIQKLWLFNNKTLHSQQGCCCYLQDRPDSRDLKW